MDIELLCERVRACIPETDVKQIRMFGGLCFMVNSNMLCCASSTGLMVRVGKDQEATALESPDATPCRTTGRPMPGFITIRPEGLATDADLKRWIDMARAYVVGLPSKTKKEKPPKSGRAKPAIASRARA